MIRAYESTLVIARNVPSSHFDELNWDMPAPEGLRALHAMLGYASQAIVFSKLRLGHWDSHCRYEWELQFADVLAQAFRPRSQPYVFVRMQLSAASMFGGEMDGKLLASEELFGKQSAPQRWPQLQRPAVIQLYGEEVLWGLRDKWRSNYRIDWALQYAVLEYIVNRGGLMLDPNPRYFDARLHVWLERAGVTSEHYRRIVLIDWEGNEPVVAHELELL